MIRRPDRVGIIGLGAFGRFMAGHLAPHFELLGYDPAADAAPDGVRRTSLAETAACPVVILATPVSVMAETARKIAPLVAPDALVIDVGSVKVLPAEALKAHLPAPVALVGAHPLFGPQSGRDGIAGLRIAICPVRGDRAARRTAAFCRRVLGLRVFIVSPEEHDREAAVAQGLTHLIAKVLLAMEPLPTRMTTASFERLIEAVDMVRHDSPAVFAAIGRDNPYSAEVRRRFFAIAESLGRDLGRDLDRDPGPG